MTGTTRWSDEQKQFVRNLKAKGAGNPEIIEACNRIWPRNVGDKDWSPATIAYIWAGRNEFSKSGKGSIPSSRTSMQPAQQAQHASTRITKPASNKSHGRHPPASPAGIFTFLPSAAPGHLHNHNHERHPSVIPAGMNGYLPPAAPGQFHYNNYECHPSAIPAGMNGYLPPAAPGQMYNNYWRYPSASPAGMNTYLPPAAAGQLHNNDHGRHHFSSSADMNGYLPPAAHGQVYNNDYGRHPSASPAVMDNYRQPAVQAGMPAGNSGFMNASFSETIHPGQFAGTWPRTAPPMGPATSQAGPQVAWNNMAGPQGYPQTHNGATNYHFVPSAYAPPDGPMPKHERIPGPTYHSGSAPPNLMSPPESVSSTAPAGTGTTSQIGVTPSKKPLIIELYNPTINPEFILAAGCREAWKFVEEQQLDHAKIWEARSQDQQVILKIYNPVFTATDAAATFAAPSTTHDPLNTAASVSTATDAYASPTLCQQTDTARSTQTDHSSPRNSPPPPLTPPQQHHIASSSSISSLPQITNPTSSMPSSQDPPPPSPTPAPAPTPASPTDWTSLSPTDWNSLSDTEYWKRVDALDALKAQDLNAISAAAADTREVEWCAQLDQAKSKPQNYGYRSDDMEFSWEIDGDPDLDGPGYGIVVGGRRLREKEEEVRGGEGEAREGEGPKYDIEMNEVVEPVWYQVHDVRNA